MAGASAQLRRLGAELRRLRLATGRTQGDVGRAIGRTHACLVNWERGKTKISKSDLICLLTELRTPIELRKELERLRDVAGRGAGPWIVYGLPDWLRPLMSFEEDAHTALTFDPILIPGLLQIEDYARAVHLANPYLAGPGNVEPWVSARLRRQGRLTSAPPLHLHAVISEAALRQELDAPTVMANQIQHLITSSESDTITIQVLPLTAGRHPMHAGNFEILQFEDPTSDPPLAYFDGPLGGHLLSDTGDVGTIISMFDDIRQIALNQTDSLAFLTAILKEYRGKETTNA
jgi:transcriptional regulator with XRE-family HTH domain